ncbi:hypothetical protein GALMADRAFT_230032 [Galerina marginata CBS 339.88]|uniref:Uncharacterized protein n=1 Tax=Galerina marginata (strain CBS 339.88) TaxID=685588 RepID=A0A067SIH9_GALM3|nr:hypothetical protein GALMADRAFT_230032 [Galerina marginata CBS 339.88]
MHEFRPCLCLCGSRSFLASSPPQPISTGTILVRIPNAAHGVHTTTACYSTTSPIPHSPIATLLLVSPVQRPPRHGCLATSSSPLFKSLVLPSALLGQLSRFAPVLDAASIVLFLTPSPAVLPHSPQSEPHLPTTSQCPGCRPRLPMVGLLTSPLPCL